MSTWPPSHEQPDDLVTAALLALAGELDEDVAARSVGAVRGEDWCSLVMLAHHHRLAPRLLGLAERGRVPAPAMGTLISLTAAHRVQTAVLGTAFDELTEAFERAQLEVVALKGMVLQRTCYPTPLLRPASDIDLLVHEEDLDVASKLLSSLGYAQIEYDHQSATITPLEEARLDGYRRELQHLGEFTRVDRSHDMPVSIDLHFRLSTVFDHVAPDIAKFWAEAVPLAGHTLMLSPEDQVVHHSYHAWWDTQSIDNIRRWMDLRLAHFADLRRLVLHWDLDCERILARAADVGVGAVVHWAIGTTVDLFGSLPGSEAVDPSARQQVDEELSDRWLQRDTGSPLARWSTPASERMFDPARGGVALELLMDDYLRAHTRQGDRLQWLPVSE